MRKKILLGICTFALLLGLTACGGEKEVTYGGHDAKWFETSLESTMTVIDQLNSDQVDQLIMKAEQSDDKISTEFFTQWKECSEIKGDFVECKDFKLEKSGKTLTATIVADCSNRDLKLTYVFNVNKIDEGPTAINVEPVYTLGETMQKAGLNTVMGIMIVFCMLVVMSLIISSFKLISGAGAPKKEEKVETTEVVNTPVTGTDDLELVAVIAAAIAASTGASTDSFVVRSIKKRR